MTDAQTIDVIRWTFTADPARGEEIRAYLTDLGLDVYAAGEGRFAAIWEEPDADPDEVIAALWEINGAPFEVTHEEFRRVQHLVYEADEAPEEATAAVA